MDANLDAAHSASFGLGVSVLLWPVMSYIGGLGIFRTVLTLLMYIGGTEGM